MWKLTIEDDEQAQISLQLAHDEYSVGRADSSAIRLTDRNVSRKHAVLKRSGDGWLVVDVDSYNGTYVNGLRVVGEQLVSHGDVVQLGDYRLEFTDEAKLAPPSPEAAPAPLPVHHRPDRLVVVVGPQPGQEFFLDREHFTIGRSEDAHISINHSSVSRIHAELYALGGGRFEIIDRGSANGLRINGQEVKRGLLEAGDALELGDVRLRFVGAGKIFRPGFDRSQALPAITGLDPSGNGQARKPGSSSLVKMVAIGALLGVIGVAAVGAYLATRPVTPAGASPSATVEAEVDPGRVALDEAKAFAEAGELEKAHEKIATIPESSAARDDEAVRAIEGTWADSLFKRFDETEDREEKRALVYRIASTPTVDPERRKRAVALLKEIDPDAVEPELVPGGGKWTPPPGWTPPTATAKPSAKPAGSGDVGRTALKDPQGAIDALLPRLGTGTLTENELRMLIGLCIQKNNPACRNQASAELSKLRKQQQQN